MDVKIITWSPQQGWSDAPEKAYCEQCQWALYFGASEALVESRVFEHLKGLLPQNTIILGCSTGGEILNAEVQDDTVVVSLVSFKSVKLEAFKAIAKVEESYETGCNLALALNKPGLKNIFLLSDGLHINGDELVRGIFDKLGEGVIVTGGLAGDGQDFKSTYVGLNEQPVSGCLAAVGFYGEGLRIGYGSVGGWDTFGPERMITKSKGNILYELDGQPALDLYKAYLKEKFQRPGGTLLFPLSVRPKGVPMEHSIVRTVLAVDENERCLIFAGDVPEGHIARLMQGNFDNLVDGAAKAANLAADRPVKGWDLAVLVSCIGRKILLGQRIADETEAVKDTLPNTPMIGFYSYGEICHHEFTQECGLHNQTMTITLFSEDK